MSKTVLTGKPNIKGMMANSTAVDHAFMYPKGGGGVPSAKPIVKPHGNHMNPNQSIKGNITKNGENMAGK